jgi:hypothetical protein
MGGLRLQSISDRGWGELYLQLDGQAVWTVLVSIVGVSPHFRTIANCFGSRLVVIAGTTRTTTRNYPTASVVLFSSTQPNREPSRLRR